MCSEAELSQLSEIIRVLSRLLSDENHVDIRGFAAWLFGLCYDAAGTSSESRGSGQNMYMYNLAVRC
jgi:hypothetical protein